MKLTCYRAAALGVAIAAALAGNAAEAAARIETELANQLAQALPTQRFEVVVTFKQSGAPNAGQIAAMKALGISRGVSMHQLPITGGLASPSAIRQLAKRDDVLSIVVNRKLRYFNADARQLSGVDALQADPDYGYTGVGVSVVINDSGIDAVHSDLAYGSRVVENVQAISAVSRTPISARAMAPIARARWAAAARNRAAFSAAWRRAPI